MNKEISTILKNRLVGLPFTDTIAGMVQRVEYRDVDQDNNPVTKRMPVAYDVSETANACLKGPERALVPDSSKRSIIYFEDSGSSFIDRQSSWLHFRSALTLVCWMNRARLTGDSYSEISAHVIASTVGKIVNRQPESHGIFTRLITNVTRIMPQDATVFSKYTYDETVTQYLRPPFEFFGLLISVDYRINPDCVNSLQIQPASCY
jgi:hypothetical protein